ncbi:MAG TPA: pyridoxal-phosphate dependent enzyme, partial [Armatimonadota bacterium]|nr:pyridoxal-phosphate dependent enzyme [Armatimonadota bacterium]
MSANGKERIADSITELIGKTPHLRLHRITAGLPADVVVKVESFNPGGSIKDRAHWCSTLPIARGTICATPWIPLACAPSAGSRAIRSWRR